MLPASSLSNMHPLAICPALGLRVKFIYNEKYIYKPIILKRYNRKKNSSVTHVEMNSSWRILDKSKDFFSIEYIIIHIFCLPCF